MTTNLKSSSIVPQELYVRRNADDQLAAIVEEMGRPGYVLVARQMGKTNLLLNMKRDQEKQGNIVYYIDLSIRHESSRSLFRSIIDGILELMPDSFDPVRDDISVKRDSQALEANIEYDRHLRLVLRNISCKLILILDEVDSLINVSYSDTIFSQIRSMYFSRTNQRDYNRLTYVLSGVAEPTDLIKDKNISPFNIGQKIYLESFTLQEIKTLVLNADLRINDNIIASIHDWTGGNPRMTWDILSETEKLLCNQSVVGSADIDTIVQKLYLTRFDLAPVDSIRLAVEQDAELRASVISIKWGKGDTLTDRAKDRLYLAGITKAVTDDMPLFSNRIIERALSDAWLDKIARAQPSIVDLANESFNSGAYRKTVNLLSEYISGLDAEQDPSFTPLIQLGMSYYYLGDFDYAFDWLTQASEVAKQTEHLAVAKFYRGASALQIGQMYDARENFVAASMYDGPLQNSAVLGTATIDLMEGTPVSLARCVQASRSLISKLLPSIQNATISADVPEVITSAYSCLYRALVLQGNSMDAEQAFLDAFDIAPISLKPALIAIRVQHHKDQELRLELLNLAVNIVIDNKITYSESANAQLNFNESYVAIICDVLLELGDRSTALRLLDYAANSIYKRNKSVLSIIVDLVNKADALTNNVYNNLAWYAVDELFTDGTSLHLKLHIHRYLAKNEHGVRASESVSSFIKVVELGLNTNFNFSDEDFKFLAGYGSVLLQEQRFSETVSAARLASRVMQRLSQPLPEYLFMSRYQEFEALQNQGKFEEAKVVGHTVVVEIDKTLRSRNDISQDLVGAMKLLRKRVSDAMTSSIFRGPDLNTADMYPKIGRNDFVTVRDAKSGAVITTKYKKVALAIRSNEQILLSVNRNFKSGG